MGAPNLLADNMEYGLSYSVVSYLKKLSQQVRSWVGCCVLLPLGTYHRKSECVCVCDRAGHHYLNKFCHILFLIAIKSNEKSKPDNKLI